MAKPQEIQTSSCSRSEADNKARQTDAIKLPKFSLLCQVLEVREEEYPPLNTCQKAQCYSEPQLLGDKGEHGASEMCQH